MPDLNLENELYNTGYQLVAAADEVGRGCLFGEVCVAAVIMPPGLIIPGVADSKKLSVKKRDQLAVEIIGQAMGIGYGIVSAGEIDRTDILRATFEAFRRAIAALDPQPDYALIDGNQKIPKLMIPQMTVIGGDNRSHSIAAASILAKVKRDAMMEEYECTYPGYGLASNKGYGTRDHLEAIRRLGPTPIHRMTFTGVKEIDESKQASFEF
ncbi:ribonuclease HII (plasmid) [Trichlorobacter lovleyi]|uniref:ribonuclease HII n=1 Tax=Trichlorobacter lovleyi TaxID=313985 RepID=UPI00223E93E2|nr:ribonuclease HII [Trichlorobacter lovleyi]QOX80887.1 ribonuclease HII [Trichlorobacter lovleyi]